jgi:hypothetical protein
MTEREKLWKEQEALGPFFNELRDQGWTEKDAAAMCDGINNLLVERFNARIDARRGRDALALVRTEHAFQEVVEGLPADLRAFIAQGV